MKTWHILILVASLVALECTSKTTPQIQVASPINLQLGISLDSAEKLMKSEGWVWDSILVDNPNITRIRFHNLYVANVGNALAGGLRFENGFLFSIVLAENTNLNNNSPTTEDYDRLVAWVKSVYGVPSDSGISYGTAIHGSYTRWNVPSETGMKNYGVGYIHGSNSWLYFSGVYAKNRNSSRMDTLRQ